MRKNYITVNEQIKNRLFELSVMEPNTGCQIWLGGTTKSGYGVIYHGKKLLRAHRTSYMVNVINPIPNDLDVLHKCDNRLCINPDHLYLGTHQQNMLDRNTRGRKVYGENSGMAKITDELAMKILASPKMHKIIAIELGVSKGIVSAIKSGRAWKHLHSKQDNIKTPDLNRVRGEEKSNSILTRENVEHIRRKELRNIEYCRLYSVKPSTVTCIQNPEKYPGRWATTTLNG